jgi:hypothetical protein
MNLYFLVEGHTELKLYPQWIQFLLPEFTQVNSFDQVQYKNYYIFGGAGIPSIINDHLPAAIEDVNSMYNYNHLVMCLDAEESSVQERLDEVNCFLQDNKVLLRNATLNIIVQNRCIETWLLGNRKLIPIGNIGGKLAEYREFFDVFKDDPELMGKHSEFNTHAQFHKSYLKSIYDARGLSKVYSGICPRDSGEQHYFDQIKNRIQKEPQHLQTFQTLLQFCDSVREKLAVEN